jgi:hypothetical protein
VDDYLNIFDPGHPLGPVALWIDDRLDDICAPNVPGRLYGLRLMDDIGIIEGTDGAVRLTGLGDGYPYELLRGPSGVLALAFDAVGLVCHGWAGAMPGAEGPPLPPLPRPSTQPDRLRVRTVTVADGSGEQATVLNLIDTGERHLMGRGSGGIPDALDLLYGGSPARSRRCRR